MNASRPTVYIVDDDAAVRESLMMLMETEGVSAQAFSSARDFLDGAPDDSRGCLVTDMRMPGISGMELLVRLKQQASPLPVVMITAYGDVPTAVEAMRLGAADFLEKPYSEGDLIGAVREALAIAADSQTRAALREDLSARFALLAPIERRVLAGLLDGKLNKTIAAELKFSLRKTEGLRANVMAKLGAQGLSDLVRAAMIVGMDEIISAGSDDRDPSAPR